MAETIGAAAVRCSKLSNSSKACLGSQVVLQSGDGVALRHPPERREAVAIAATTRSGSVTVAERDEPDAVAELLDERLLLLVDRAASCRYHPVRSTS